MITDSPLTHQQLEDSFSKDLAEKNALALKALPRPAQESMCEDFLFKWTTNFELHEIVIDQPVYGHCRPMLLPGEWRVQSIMNNETKLVDGLLCSKSNIVTFARVVHDSQYTPPVEHLRLNIFKLLFWSMVIFCALFDDGRCALGPMESEEDIPDGEAR